VQPWTPNWKQSSNNKPTRFQLFWISKRHIIMCYMTWQATQIFKKWSYLVRICMVYLYQLSMWWCYIDLSETVNTKLKAELYQQTHWISIVLDIKTFILLFVCHMTWQATQQISKSWSHVWEYVWYIFINCWCRWWCYIDLNTIVWAKLKAELDECNRKCSHIVSWKYGSECSTHPSYTYC